MTIGWNRLRLTRRMMRRVFRSNLTIDGALATRIRCLAFYLDSTWSFILLGGALDWALVIGYVALNLFPTRNYCLASKSFVLLSEAGIGILEPPCIIVLCYSSMHSVYESGSGKVWWVEAPGIVNMHIRCLFCHQKIS